MTSSGPTSFFWFDFETTGTDPARDRPMQFAGIRTDLNFQPIGEPIMLYCRLSEDVLPQPEACLLTGITPQDANREGLCEAEFMQAIEAELSQPGTCALGYNTIRFDDEVVRYGFYRNFIDPYAREWQNNCSRWDIIDLVRMAYAMRPDGIVWPKDEEGQVSMKLEALTKANNIAHDQAHDALSDVYGTIEMAKLIRDKQPKLFHYYLKMRQKHELQQFIDPVRMKPFLHISGMFGQARKYAAFVVPLAAHPTNKNGVIVYDLMSDAQPLVDLSVEEIRHRVFTSKEALGEVERLPLKVIHYNKSPAVAPATFLKDKAVVERLELDGDICRRNLALLKQHAYVAAKIRDVFMQEERAIPNDPDLMLYSGGFFSRDDKARMETIRSTPPEALNELEMSFDDRRLPEMLMRYIGRNYPEYLNEQQREQWEEYRMIRLTESDGGGSITMMSFFERLNSLAQTGDLAPAKQIMLQDLADYAQGIYPIG
ncbi:Exodeoxyribonuclease I [Marinomonas spartinae]|uniref:Exodeoxyribonuclease I n=1 Tax=Marinomonas spartinae TaxID=1792290 RepID=A0A1A8TD05_9GAMM|nr:exodeoxyribonuclease I [Marinomonas spartinae]SBS29828.1 Exodeoxyribonuclease I [Marinomonas spartinae]SBS37237.1 Exodeoxyribonuclease I [Marinomonas spartinae]